MEPTKTINYEDSYVRMIITVTSLLASKNYHYFIFIVISITVRHYQKAQWMNYQLPKELQKEVYSLKIFDQSWKRERRRHFISKSYIIELILVSIHPLPYWDPTFEIYSINVKTRKDYAPTLYHISHILLILMFIRVAFLVRTIFNYSNFTDLYAKRLW